MNQHTRQFELLRRVLHLSNLLQTKGDTLYDEFSAKQWYLLCYVDSYGDMAPTLRELAQKMGTSHQNTRQMVAKLEQKGYLRLETDPSDRRKTRVSLTEKTAPLWEKYQIIQETYIQQHFQSVSSDELEISLATLEKLEMSLANSDHHIDNV